MVFSLTWLPEVLEAAGLKVAETENWRSRGRAEMGTVRGVMCHHTATPGHLDKNMPTLDMLIAGRSDLAGPLCQLGLGRDGTFYVVAAGRANHAGAGSWEGITTGNSSFIGIEAEHSGRTADPWPEAQMDAYRRGVAAILKKIGAEAKMCCGHKEYALPAGRKPDPNFDMPTFRNAVADLLRGRSPEPPIPAVDDARRPTIRRGARGEVVRELQRLLHTKVDGIFGPNTEAKLRAFQRAAEVDPKLVPDGIAGPKTWAALAGPPGAAAPPPPPAPAPAPAQPVPSGAIPAADDDTHKPTVSGTRALGLDGARFATVKNSGFFTNGTTRLEAWLSGRAPPPAVSASVLRVMKAVSQNEGLLEAVNSYDNAFLSLGILQWTAGAGDGDGELPTLLNHLQKSDPAAFQDCFGRYGLGAKVASDTAMYGQLTLDGDVLDKAAKKAQLRDVKWAYRFWRAGHDDSVRLAQFSWAAGRIGRFLNAPGAGHPLNAWITSELGIAQLLDEHTNRPGHVPGTLAKGIQAIGATDPTGWTTAREAALIAAYLTARANRPANGRMTDTAARAARIAALVGPGKLSADRGSFVP